MDVVIFSCSHALILLAPSNHTSGFSNEISFVFEFQADLGIYKNKLKVEGPDPYVKFTLKFSFSLKSPWDQPLTLTGSDSRYNPEGARASFR